jgi:hypothetical protein
MPTKADAVRLAGERQRADLDERTSPFLCTKRWTGVL